jgi:molecular chaperone IbpA
MVSYDIDKFDPFFVGADRLFRHLDNLQRMTATPTNNYPPYNILKVDDDHYAIKIAVAGFTEEDLDVTLEDSKLTVVGKEFTLADTIQIEDAKLEHGMLTISLINVIPEDKKPKKIPILTNTKLLDSSPELLTEA